MSKITFIEETTVTVDEYGCIEPSFSFRRGYSSTSGYLKYLPLKEGTKVRVRIEVLEDSDEGL